MVSHYARAINRDLQGFLDSPHALLRSLKNAIIHNQTLSLPYLRLILGIVALILSLYSSTGFLSQGATGIAFVAVLAFCIVAEFVKCLFAGDVAFYSALKMPDKALFALCVIIMLFVLSIMEEVWFLVSHPLKDAVQLNNAAARSATLQHKPSLPPAILLI